MGTWNTGIFDDDVALDVKNLFEDLIIDNMDTVNAVYKVLEEFKEALEEPDDSCVIYITLARLMLTKKVFLPDIQQKALECIIDGKELARWQDADFDTRHRRKLILEELRVELESFIDSNGSGAIVVKRGTNKGAG